MTETDVEATDRGDGGLAQKRPADAGPTDQNSELRRARRLQQKNEGRHHHQARAQAIRAEIPCHGQHCLGNDGNGHDRQAMQPSCLAG